MEVGCDPGVGYCASRRGLLVCETRWFGMLRVWSDGGCLRACECMDYALGLHLFGLLGQCVEKAGVRCAGVAEARRGALISRATRAGLQNSVASNSRRA